MVDKPEKTDCGEGAKVGEVLGAVALQGRCQTAAVAIPDRRRVWDVVLAEGTKRNRKEAGLEVLQHYTIYNTITLNP